MGTLDRNHHTAAGWAGEVGDAAHVAGIPRTRGRRGPAAALVLGLSAAEVLQEALPLAFFVRSIALAFAGLFLIVFKFRLRSGREKKEFLLLQFRTLQTVLLCRIDCKSKMTLKFPHLLLSSLSRVSPAFTVCKSAISSSFSNM